MGKRIKYSIVAAGMLLASFAGSAYAATTYTGNVAIFYTQDYTAGQVYTFVKLTTANGGFAYGFYAGVNTAVATIIDNARRHNATVTLDIDYATGGGLITAVR